MSETFPIMIDYILQNISIIGYDGCFFTDYLNPRYEEEGLKIVKENLEKGFMGIGEVAAASTYSPIVSKLKWKAEHPMDGNLPLIYEMAAQYKTPLLLHIDPASGHPIAQLERALIIYRDTTFIFAHANVENFATKVELLVRARQFVY
ncbi:hypothetical protein ACFSCX_00735 [Bacillus salitolerans]|uniref:Amidohydrolase-related domain-containing protein n=1 Tax=Bacillus salitolerans TaxID=1437434 RepID=A0ABW4LIZ7_9BACI